MVGPTVVDIYDLIDEARRIEQDIVQLDKLIEREAKKDRDKILGSRTFKKQDDLNRHLKRQPVASIVVTKADAVVIDIWNTLRSLAAVLSSPGLQSIIPSNAPKAGSKKAVNTTVESLANRLWADEDLQTSLVYLVSVTGSGGTKLMWSGYGLNVRSGPRLEVAFSESLRCSAPEACTLLGKQVEVPTEPIALVLSDVTSTIKRIVYIALI